MNIQSNGSGSDAATLEKVSYSKLSTFDQCPRKFLYKYEQKKRGDISSLALEIGTITHYGKELVAQALLKGEKPDYEQIISIVMTGYDEEVKRIVDEDGEQVVSTDELKKETEIVHVLGTDELKQKYFFEWIEPDNKSGMNYDEKLAIYFNNLHSLELETQWKPIACEPEFDFPYQGLFRLYGFIDRVDTNETGDFRVVDYKSSKKIFDDKDIKTPLQMFIYALAVEHMHGKIPTEFLYDFIFLDTVQEACSKGYHNRGTKKLLKLWEELCTCRESGIWKPKPTPLCHWCDYCRTNPRASDEYKNECPYFSLWTPQNKTFEKNKDFDPGAVEAEKKTEGFWF